jgi:O-acetyl-ADP-ribose deacetylase (regulator of RNase III)
MNLNISFEFISILVVALLLLTYGVWLYLKLIKRSNPKLFYSSVMISWVLISLFPVVLLFSVFQDSSLTGELTGTSFGTITVGGAFGAFFVLWIMGTRNTLKAINADNNEETIYTLNEQIKNLEDQFAELKSRPRDTRIIPESRKIEYYFTYNKKKRILGMITGDIQQIRGIDLWVNSENTNLQMGRFYDPSMSGLIRYLGAKKDKEGNVIEDTIASALMDSVKEEVIEDGTNRNDFPSVKPGLAFTTTSGNLKTSHGVQGIIHVTTVFGEIGQGYTPIKNLGICVQNALRQADQFASDNKRKNVSIVFPLFGTGSAKGRLEDIAQNLFYAVLSYFETRQESQIEKVYFLAWKEYEKNECVNVLNNIADLTPRKP